MKTLLSLGVRSLQTLFILLLLPIFKDQQSFEKDRKSNSLDSYAKKIAMSVLMLRRIEKAIA